jgi:polysaccharide biosynthesis transport protein
MPDDNNSLEAISTPSVLAHDAFAQATPTARRSPYSFRPATSDQANGLSFVLNALRRRWKWVLPLALLLGCGAAAAVVLLFKPSYEAVACLKIESHAPHIAFEMSGEDRDASKSFLQTQVNLLRHPVVLSPVVALPEVARIPEIASESDPVRWLAKRISVKRETESELYDISFAAHDPKAAATVVNALLDEYFRLREQEDASRTKQVIKTLNSELDERSAKVKDLRETVRELTKQVTGKDPVAGAAESSVVVNNNTLLADQQNRLANAEVQEAVLAAELQAYQSTAEPEVRIPDAMIQKTIDMNHDVLQTKRENAGLQFQLDELNAISKRGGKDPEFLRIKRQIEENNKFLTQLRNDLREQIRLDHQSTASANRQDKIATLQAELDRLRNTVKELRKLCESQVKDVKETSGDALTLRFKQGELDRAEKVYGLIAQRIVELSTETHAPERVIVIQKALVPTAPIEVFPYRNILVAALAGFVLPFGLALGAEKLIQRVGDAANLENASRLPVVGEIARLPTRIHGSHRSVPARMGLGMQMFEESINSLRTTLMLAENLCDLRVLAVTSAVTHEGKTSVAVQLAMSLARSTNKPTLLIDGDMRSPNLHDIFETPLIPGLAKVLEGKSSIDEAIVATSCPALDLLPAGELNSNPHHLLGNGGPAALLRGIPEKYRYVVIDTPPVLAASESLVLAKMADATLVCVLRDVSRIDQVKKAYQRLLIGGSKPVGLVLNGVPTRTYAHHYGSYAYVRR